MTRQFPVTHSRWQLRLIRFRLWLRQRHHPDLRREIMRAAIELGVPEAIPANWKQDGTLRR